MYKTMFLKVSRSPKEGAAFATGIRANVTRMRRQLVGSHAVTVRESFRTIVAAESEPSLQNMNSFS